MRIIQSFVKRDQLSKLSFSGEAYSDDNGQTWRWTSNHSVIAPVTCREYEIPCDQEAQAAARDTYFTQVMTDYRKNQATTPSAEERSAARAAYGPGHLVVDVISGRQFHS